MRATRVLLGAAGLAAALWGVKLLLDLGGANLRAAAIWLVGGVLLHDAVIGPAVIAIAMAAALLRGRLTAPVIAGAVVLGTVTVVAVPMLGRFGARPDNPTLLDRDYVVGWLVLAGLTLAAIALALVRERRTKGRDRGAGAGHR